MGDGEWGMGNRERGTGRAIGNGQWGTGNEERGTRYLTYIDLKHVDGIMQV